jgi:hypothetical protein
MPDAQCSLLPAVFFTANALKRGFKNRRVCSRCISGRCLSGQEHLDLEFLIYRPSSVVHRPRFVPLRFAIFFYSKII